MADTSFELKVDTQVMKTVSAEVSQNISKTKTAFENLSRVVNATTQYWDGSGHDAMQRFFTSRKDDYEKVFAILEEHIKNLTVMAGVYEEAEKVNEEVPSILPDDVLF